MSGDFSRFRQVVDSIKAKDLGEYIGRYCPLERIGRLQRCSSPFRRDSDPSFTIYPDGLWHDFGTKESGDIIKFVMLREHCDFKAAVAKLCHEFGIEAYWEKHEAGSSNLATYEDEMRRMVERHAVFDILTEAANYWWAHCPSKICKDLLIEHYGLSIEIIDQLKLGYASIDAPLREHLLSKGYASGMIEKSGLYKQRSDGTFYARFRNRLIFPYWHAGQVVYLIARRTEQTPDEDWEKAKYKKLATHSESHPEVSQHLKNEYFYNEDCCLGGKLVSLVITEGVTDCISAMQIGEACISPVTTSFRKDDTQKLVGIIKRCQAERVFICNDKDRTKDGREPGKEGALRTGLELLQHGIDVRVCELPSKDDPNIKVDLNDYLKEAGSEGAKAFATVKDRARPVLAFLIDAIPEDTSPIELGRRLEPIKEATVGCPMTVHEEIVKLVSRRFKLSKSEVRSDMKRAVAEHKKSLPPPPLKEEEKKDKSLATELIKGAVYEEFSYYYCKGRDGDEVISNFVITPKKAFYEDKSLWLVGDITNDRGEAIHDFLFPPNTWKSKRDLLSVLKNYRFNWMGSDECVQGLAKRLGGAEVPTIDASSAIGYHDADGVPKWIWKGGIIYGDRIEFGSKEILYTESNTSQVDRLFAYQDVSDDEVRELLQEAIPLLFSVNSTEVVLPILGWIYACALKPRLMTILGHFPILLIWGTRGSGKSSIVREVMLPLVGVDRQHEPFSCDDSKFTLTRKLSASTSCPVFMDEHKPRDMAHGRADLLHRTLRRAYGGEAEQRGRGDLSVETIKLTSPIILAGESPPEDPATLERIIQVCPSPVFLQKNESARKAFQVLRSMPLEKLAASFVKFSLKINNLESRVQVARERLKGAYETLGVAAAIPPRVVDNHICALLGLDYFHEWVLSTGIQLAPFDMYRIARSLTSELIDSTDGSIINRDALDNFLEYLSSLVPTGVVTENEIFAWENKDTPIERLAINLNGAYNCYCEARKKAGLQDETGGLKALRRAAKDNQSRGSYVDVIDKQVRFHRPDPNNRFHRFDRIAPDPQLEIVSKPRCLIVDLTKATSLSLDFSKTVNCT